MFDIEALNHRIEAYDGYAATARWQAHTLRRRWWRAYLDADEVVWWRGRIADCEKRACEMQAEADACREILRDFLLS